MGRRKIEDAEWEDHREEIRALYQWKTLEQIKEYMAQQYNFCKRLVHKSLASIGHGFSDVHDSKDQYTRKFKTWNLKKNSKEDEWRFVSRRMEKRKLEGKEETEVEMHGRVLPEKKCKKEISRHVPLSSWYMGDPGKLKSYPPGEDKITRRPLY